MTVDHSDIAQQAFASAGLPAPPRTVEQAFVYLKRLLSMLPAAEKAGFVRAPAGGENVVTLPDGTPVRISRIAYPDGQLYKVMSDAPNGGPEWADNGIAPELYEPTDGVDLGGVPPVVVVVPSDSSDAIQGVVEEFNAKLDSIVLSQKNLTQQVVDLNNAQEERDSPASV